MRARHTLLCCCFVGLFGLATNQTFAQFVEPVVPGFGRKIKNCGDDFEAKSWRYYPNFPKSSRNIDEEERSPLGTSANKRWLEGPHRGTPDVLRRVPTPDDGLSGSRYSMLLQTSQPGIPGEVTGKPQQDDLMVKVKRRIGHPIPAEWSPSCVVRVYVPPFEEWENRSGASFGFRTDCWGRRPNQTGEEPELEQFWPGMFFVFQNKSQSKTRSDAAYMNLRADNRGRDLRGPELQPGWWTLGLSVSSDGKCHYYAKKGTDDLTADDHLGSYFCYGYRVDRLDLFFFNVVTDDDGRSTSTPWIIDDPEFFCEVPDSYDRRAMYERFNDSDNQVRHASGHSGILGGLRLPKLSFPKRR